MAASAASSPLWPCDAANSFLSLSPRYLQLEHQKLQEPEAAGLKRQFHQLRLCIHIQNEECRP